MSTGIAISRCSRRDHTYWQFVEVVPGPLTPDTLEAAYQRAHRLQRKDQGRERMWLYRLWDCRLGHHQMIGGKSP